MHRPAVRLTRSAFLVVAPLLLAAAHPTPSRAQQAMDTLMGAARESGATLVTSLHDVPMALRCFPRIIGLRDGQLMFDRPAAAVDAELLQRLYERKLDELQPPPGGRAVDEPAPRESAPATMHCR